jgi:7-dehydrocholesterol reductase
MNKNPFNADQIQKHLRHCVGPLLLITCCLIPFMMLMWYTNIALGGSVEKLYRLFSQRGFLSTLYTIWHPYFFGTLPAWKIFGFFTLTALCCFKILPGLRFYNGPIAADGTLAVSKANGLSAFLLVMALYFVGSCVLKWFSPTIIYDHFGALLGTLNTFSVLFWFFSYVKEKKSSTPKTDGLGHPLLRFIDWHLNVFTICRCAMIGWGVIISSFAAKQYILFGLADSMMVCVGLQLAFIVKFFLWEIGYLRAMDISYDRAGLFLCWGSIVWIPAIYTSPALYLIHHPYHLGLTWSLILFICGASCIFINFLVDRQRQYVRDKNGDCLVWRKKPDLIFANYRTEWGEEKQNLLLVSGWWGISRHFHYIPELLGAFFWCAPALFKHFLPYFYLCFLTLLLIDRAYRHERRCAMKYGKDWEKYCEKVPFRIIPFIY